MTEDARTLALVLLKRHRDICSAYRATPTSVTDRMIEESVIFYGDLCEKADVPFLTRTELVGSSMRLASGANRTGGRF